MDKKIVKKLIKLTEKREIRWRVTNPNSYTQVYSALYHYIPIHLTEISNYVDLTSIVPEQTRYTLMVAGVYLNVKQGKLTKLRRLICRKRGAWIVHADREESLPKWVADNFK